MMLCTISMLIPYIEVDCCEFIWLEITKEHENNELQLPGTLIIVSLFVFHRIVTYLIWFCYIVNLFIIIIYIIIIIVIIIIIIIITIIIIIIIIITIVIIIIIIIIIIVIIITIIMIFFFLLLLLLSQLILLFLFSL